MTLQGLAVFILAFTFEPNSGYSSLNKTLRRQTTDWLTCKKRTPSGSLSIPAACVTVVAAEEHLRTLHINGKKIETDCNHFLIKIWYTFMPPEYNLIYVMNNIPCVPLSRTKLATRTKLCGFFYYTTVVTYTKLFAFYFFWTKISGYLSLPAHTLFSWTQKIVGGWYSCKVKIVVPSTILLGGSWSPNWLGSGRRPSLTQP